MFCKGQSQVLDLTSVFIEKCDLNACCCKGIDLAQPFLLISLENNVCYKWAPHLNHKCKLWYSFTHIKTIIYYSFVNTWWNCFSMHLMIPSIKNVHILSVKTALCFHLPLFLYLTLKVTGQYVLWKYFKKGSKFVSGFSPCRTISFT